MELLGKLRGKHADAKLRVPGAIPSISVFTICNKSVQLIDKVFFHPSSDCVADDVLPDWVPRRMKNELGRAERTHNSQTAPSPDSGCLSRRKI